MKTQFVILWVATIIFAVLRFSGIHDDVFKDFAHLFVGATFGAYCASQDKRYLIIFAFLTIAEVIAFALSKLL